MFEAYSVAIRLSLSENVTVGLAALAGQFGLFNRHLGTTQGALTDVEKRIKSIKTLGLVGGGMLGAGAIGLGLFEGPLKEAREYDLAFTKFKALNLGDIVNSQADQFARSANVMGVAGKDLMKTLTETVGVFGSFNIARQLVPTIAALNQANTAIFKGKIEGLDDGSSRSLVQFIDRRGGMKSAELAKAGLDLAERLVTGSGGFIQFKDLAAFSQFGGTAFRSLSDQGVINYAYLMSEQGGHRAGTAMMSIYQNLVAGRTTKRAMAELASFGIGKIATVDAGLVAGRHIRTNTLIDIPKMDLLTADAPTWFRTVFLPLLAKKGVTQEKDILRITNDLLSNRTASGQATIMDTQSFQILRDAKLVGNAMGVDAVIAGYKKDPNAQFSELYARWADTQRELGLIILPAAVKGMEGLNAFLKGAIAFGKEFPTLTKSLVGATAALFGLSAAAGAFTLATAGLKAIGLAGGAGPLSRLAKVGVVAGVGALAYEGIKGLQDYIAAKTGWTLGGWLYEKINGAYDPNAKSPHIDKSPRSVIAGTTTQKDGGGSSPFVISKPPIIHFTIENNPKNNWLETKITQTLGKGLNMPQTGPSTFDGTMALEPAGSGNLRP